MDPQEGEARIRNRVDEGPAQSRRLRPQDRVVAAERDDADPARVTGHGREAVGVEARAGHQVACRDRAGRRLEDQPVRRPPDPADLRPGSDLAAAGHDRLAQGEGEPAPVDDPGAGNVERAKASDLRLHLQHRLRPQRAQGHPVGLGSLGDGRQPRKLSLRGRHDELAADLVRDPVLVGEGDGGTHPLGAEAGLERSWRVGVGRMDDAAVATGLVGGEHALLLHHDEAQARARLEEPVGGRKADDSPPTTTRSTWWSIDGLAQPSRSAGRTSPP